VTPIRRVLCPIDFSDASRRAFGHAAAFAQWYGAHLTMLTVFVTSSVLDVPARQLDDRERARLTSALHHLRRSVPDEVSTDIVVAESSEAHEAILAHAASGQYDLLVMGTHGRSGFRRFFLGSVVERVLRQPPCLMLVVPPHAPVLRPGDPPPTRHIVCAVDFSGGSSAALPVALSLAQKANAEVLALHVIEFPPELLQPDVPPPDVDDIRAAAEADRLGRLKSLIPNEARKFCTVETAVAEGAADRTILQASEARHADLVIMGVSHHRTFDRLIFGSTASRVTRTAACPVLLVPERTAETPAV
jgi:nucleotide-binding universal stress UspA family protein